MAQDRVNVALDAVSEALRKNVREMTHELVGSTYIKDSDQSDVDILVLDETAYLEELTFSGWEYGGSTGLSPDNDNWMSWKKTVHGVTVNMLIVTNRGYYYSWLTAAEVCRFLHLQGYDIRKASVHGIHEIVMDDSDAETENKQRDY